MDWWLLLAVFLYFACAVLIVAEIFVPSGGLISICALVCLIGGLMIFFQSSAVAGWVGIVAALIEVPVVLIIAYKIFPKTRFGKTVTLAPPVPDAGEGVPDTADLKELLDETGEVITPLRPVGMCDFSGRRVECVAEGGYVDNGKKVKVIKVESTQLTVREVQEN
ncbi:MAG: NfeD family protein [Phycisphaerales bacterium]|jgi:membrane-bound ClpP family serine protease